MIVIHIGLRKSGSASLQRFLSDNEDALRRMSIDYPRLGRVAQVHGTAHLNLARELQGSRRFNPGDGTLAQLADYRRVTPGRGIVLSTEIFEECEAAQAARLRDALGGDNETFRIVLILRDLIDLTPSSYAQKIKHGLNTYDFDAFFEERMGERRVNYFETARRWADAFGWDSMRVRVLDPAHLLNGDLVEDFLDIVGVDPDGEEARALPRPGIVNVAPGWRVLEAIRALYACRHGLPGGHPLARAAEHDRDERMRVGIRAVDVGERRGWNQDKGRYLTRAQARRCLDVNARAIDALNERLADQLPTPLSLDARAFQERDFAPDATHIPREQLRAFYDELGPPAAD